MTTKKTTFENVQQVAKRITEWRLEAFVRELRNNLPSVNGRIQWEQIKGKEFPASVIDGWLRRAQSQSRLDGVSLNIAAFEQWKALEEMGAVIVGHDNCQIVPDPRIESKLARTVERKFVLRD